MLHSYIIEGIDEYDKLAKKYDFDMHSYSEERIQCIESHIERTNTQLPTVPMSFRDTFNKFRKNFRGKSNFMRIVRV